MTWNVEIKEWHAIANWTWNAGDDVCSICRMPFDGCPPDCKVIITVMMSIKCATGHGSANGSSIGNYCTHTVTPSILHKCYCRQRAAPEHLRCWFDSYRHPRHSKSANADVNARRTMC